jgi:epsilon-lactone hydrolase
MPSWQARALNALTRSVVRRPSWGRDQVLAERARRVFGATRMARWRGSRGLRVEPVAQDGVAGEWQALRGSASPEIVFYLHGGGYVSCSPITHRPITGALVRLSRRRLFSLSYRLAPEHPYPAALDDALAAYRWLLASGIAPGAIAVAGDSAGGGLALSLLLRARADGLPLPACAVLFSPWTDLAVTGRSQSANEGRDPMFFRLNMDEFASAYLGSASPLDPLISPLYGDLAGLPPLLLQVGSTELLLDDARRVHEKVQAAGGTSRLQVFDELCHCWQMADGFVPEARVALHQAVEFMNAY